MKYMVFTLLLFSQIASAIEIDFSRRRKTYMEREVASESPESKSETKTVDLGVFDNWVPADDSKQEIVIMQTEKGFVPHVVRLRKDQSYVIYLVNVNEKEKNVSFIMDAFSEHHATYFGKIKRFEISPKKEGVYSFQSPETSQEGKLIVYTGEPQRKSASEKEE